IEELTAAANAPPPAFRRKQATSGPRVSQTNLFEVEENPEPQSERVIIVVGRTCAGKTTFGERAAARGFEFIDASSVMRSFRDQYRPTEESDLAFARRLLDEQGADVVAKRILELYEGPGTRIIAGFRAIEELLLIRDSVRECQVALVDASERTRLERLIQRPRGDVVRSLAELRDIDTGQCELGLLRVAQDFADVQIVNEGSIEEYYRQVDSVLDREPAGLVRGVLGHGKLRHGSEANQLYRCLRALDQAGRPMSCDEVEEFSGRDGPAIRHNNAN
ncbi:unnamed protein product, partial [marine sediment metagenome]